MKPYESLSETEWTQLDHVHDLLEDGETDAARLALDALLAKRPEQPDLRIVDAMLRLEEGEPGEALDALRGGERAADPAQFFFLRAAAEFDLVRFEDALADVERALAVHAEYAVAWDLLSRICEHLGQAERAQEAAAHANDIDEESFPLPLELSDEAFDQLVEESVAELPPRIRAKLDEFPILVQPLPAREMLLGEDPPLTPDLLGLFAGRHIFAHSTSETPAAPGAIYLFRRNLLRMCADPEELAREVRNTVQHEVGHLMGLDEDELDQWGLA